MFYYDQSLQIAKVSLKKVDTLNYNNLVFNVNNNVINVKLKQNKFDEVIDIFRERKCLIEKGLEHVTDVTNMISGAFYQTQTI